MDVRGGVKGFWGMDRSTSTILEDDFGEGLPTFPSHAPLRWVEHSLQPCSGRKGEYIKKLFRLY